MLRSAVRAPAAARDQARGRAARRASPLPPARLPPGPPVRPFWACAREVCDLLLVQGRALSPQLAAHLAARAPRDTRELVATGALDALVGVMTREHARKEEAALAARVIVTHAPEDLARHAAAAAPALRAAALAAADLGLARAATQIAVLMWAMTTAAGDLKQRS